jgi:hypothetical protein
MLDDVVVAFAVDVDEEFLAVVWKMSRQIRKFAILLQQLTEIALDERRRGHIFECHNLHVRILVLQLRKRPEDKTLRSFVVVAECVVVDAEHSDFVF